ncbi:unnamed protein product [Callosobruchus maculatus]|uniref:C2H2-type domain-containing protein n=1 Tax=Callosobruchus maculatus TaxID=64391 RepID=A0A653CZD8_CALMS|nr:unnamed protein product [Callosobruchus maculatus]
MRSGKKIKLDPDLVKKEPPQEEDEEEIDDIFEESQEESSAMKSENVFIKEEMGVNIEETHGQSYKICDANLSVKTEDAATNEFPRVRGKSDRDFICTLCNYATKKVIDFTRHWLTHEEQSYTSENGVFVCHLSDCFYVAPNEENLLTHISNQHLRIYHCDFCYYVTYSKKEQEQHDTTHYTYQCVKCDLQSTKLFFVQDHSEAPLKCNKCDFTTYHWFPYKKHTNWHNYPPDSIVECGFCNFTTGDKALLEKHNAVHCTNFTHCKMCRFTGQNMTELDEHCESTHDTTLEALNKLHKCKFCTCKFIGLDSKEKHEELHSKMGVLLKCCSNTKIVQCPYCDHQENQCDDMKAHIVLQHSAALELENFRLEDTSDELNKDLKTYAADNEPVEEIKPDPEQDVVEDAAKYENVSFNSNLTGHQAPQNEIEQVKNELEVEQSRHKCPFCYYNACSKEDYDVHYKRHTTFKCKRCPLESTKQLFVEDHTENPWGCSKCDFKAHHWLLLKSHSFSHEDHGSRLLKCRECNFETKIPNDMKNHYSFHAIAAVRCRICSFETRFEDTLRKHYSNRHNVTLLDDGSMPSVERPYECDLCACKFKEQVYLDKHKALHENNGPFHVICRQCRQGNRTTQQDTNVKKKPDSWTECPYCSHEDEARYRMIQHLSRIHPSELEIEGYVFDDGQTKELVSHHTTSIDRLTSDTTLPENTDSIINSFKNEDKKFRVKEESNDAGEGTSSSKQPGCILEHKSKEHGQRMFRCNICGYRTKGKSIIEKHMDQKHPPFLTECKESPGEKILCCAGCCYTAKTKHHVKKHLLANHAIEEEAEGTSYFQIDKAMMESMEEAESNHSTEEENIESLPKPTESVGHVEEVVIKVEPSTFQEEESVEDLSANVPEYHEIDNKWYCSLCPYSSVRKHFVNQHVKQRHKGFEKKTWFCTTCPYGTKFKNSLRQHMERMHSTEQSLEATSERIPCKQPECDFKAPTVDDLSTHMARHLQSSMQEVLEYKCDLCSFGTVSKAIFRNHRQSCNGMTYWYQCYSCEFKSDSRKGILGHIDTKHRYKYTDKKGYECLKCGYSSKEKSWTEYHHVNCPIKGEVEH